MSAERSSMILPAFFTRIVDQGGEFPSGEWPEHITLFAPANGHYSEEVRAGLRRLARTASPFTVVTGGRALFGPDRTIPVRLIKPSETILGLQQRIAHVFASLDHDPTYMHPYRPHISAHRRDGKLVLPPEEASFEVGGFAVVQRLGEKAAWQVVDKIRLKGEVDT